jgi:hypothetical protein
MVEKEEDTVSCTECDAEVPEEQAIRLRARDVHGDHLVLCGDCAATFDARYQAETERPDLIHALLLGLIAGLLGAIVWFLILVKTGWEIGFVAVGLGYVVGVAAMRGAGGKRGRRVQLTAVAATVLVMLFTQYLIGQHFLGRILVREGYEPPPLLLPPDAMLTVTLLSLMDLATLALWGFALIFAYSVPRPRQLQRA